MSRAAEKPASGTMPADIAAKVRAIGPVIDPPATAAIYKSLHPREPYPSVRIERDLQYGAHARHILDVFMPEKADSSRPVLIFIHGGGYVGGHKREGDNFFYDNVMLWAVKNGMIGVNATYRLAPDHPWPAGAEDVGAVVRWVVENIAARGGDPRRVFLAGHSAGGTHVATYVAQPQFHGPQGVALAGLLLISGNYDLSKVPADERYSAYFGTDQSKYAERSPIAGLLKTGVPLFAAYGEHEPPFLFEQSENLLTALKRADRKVHSVLLPGHSHISITYHINTGDTQLADEMLAFIRANS